MLQNQTKFFFLNNCLELSFLPFSKNTKFLINYSNVKFRNAFLLQNKAPIRLSSAIRETGENSFKEKCAFGTNVFRIRLKLELH